MIRLGSIWARAADVRQVSIATSAMFGPNNGNVVVHLDSGQQVVLDVPDGMTPESFAAKLVQMVDDEARSA